MMIKNNKNNEPARVSTTLKVFRVIGVVLVLGAIAYLAWPGDFDNKGIMLGRMDDYLLFMAAFLFAHGSFQRPERRFIRRQLYMLSSLCALLALCWVLMLAFMK